MIKSFRVTISLIALNVLIFFLPSLLFKVPTEALIKAFGFSVETFESGDYYRIVTSMFIHATLAHLTSNMIALFFLGMTAEKKLGSSKFLFVYLLSGMVGNLSMYLPFFSTPKTLAVGASAAISGIVGVGSFVCPSSFVVFPSSLPFPFIVACTIYLLVTLANLFEVSHIAYHAHLFGFLTGAFIGIAMSKNRVKKLLAFFLIALILSMLPLIIGYLPW